MNIWLHDGDMFHRLAIAILVLPALAVLETEDIWDELTPPELTSKTTTTGGTSSGCPFGRRSRPAQPCDQLTQNQLGADVEQAKSEAAAEVPGAAWTDEEMMIVRAKLTRVFSVDEGTNRIVKELYPGGIPFPKWQAWRDGVTASKVLRLGFHDCMKYTDGSGGCDGCINWSGMGLRYAKADLESGTLGAGGDNHNNGLRFTVEVLEAVYTDAAFPKLTPRLEDSLKETGKSRADLWAFATMVAVEFAIDSNNLVCTNPDDPGTNPCEPPYEPCPL